MSSMMILTSAGGGVWLTNTHAAVSTAAIFSKCQSPKYAAFDRGADYVPPLRACSKTIPLSKFSAS